MKEGERGGRERRRKRGRIVQLVYEPEVNMNGHIDADAHGRMNNLIAQFIFFVDSDMA